LKAGAYRIIARRRTLRRACALQLQDAIRGHRPVARMTPRERF
jgi:hypothetical protein